MTHAPDGASDGPTTPSYPPEADPDTGDGLPGAVVPGEQVDPTRRLTGGDQPHGGGQD